MTSRPRLMACIAVAALWLPAAALADDLDAPDLQIEQELQAPASVTVPEMLGGWSDSPGEWAIDDWRAQNPWGYGLQSIFPLTLDLMAADLPLWAKIPVYPLSGIYDLIQLPFGAIGGLWGN